MSGSFSDLSRLVMERSGLISSVVFVFLHWDEERRELVKMMRSRSIPTLVLIVSEDDAESRTIDTTSTGSAIHRLHPARMAEGLALL